MYQPTKQPEDLSTKKPYPEEPPSYEDSQKESKQAPQNAPKIMISYHWNFKSIATKIRNALVGRGFEVWFDDTNVSKFFAQVNWTAKETCNFPKVVS